MTEHQPPSISPLDRASLFSSVLEATSRAFEKLREQAVNETIYVFGLYTLDTGQYVIPTGNTEEGLNRIASAAANRRGTSNELESRLLRWSPCDWEHHGLGTAFFSESQSILDGGWDNDFSEYAYRSPEIVDVYLSVLLELRNSGKVDPETLLMLLMGDQSDESRLNYARSLNPLSAFDRLKLELKERDLALTTWHRLNAL